MNVIPTERRRNDEESKGSAIVFRFLNREILISE